MIISMVEGEIIINYFARALAIVNKMVGDGERMEKILIIERILRSMTARFHYLVCFIEESK